MPLDIAYQVVAEVEHYPEFVPRVKAVKILSRNDDSIVADMKFSHKLLIVQLQSLAIFLSLIHI